MRQNFVELNDEVFQTIQIANKVETKVENAGKSEKVMSIKNWEPSRWECKLDSQTSVDRREPLPRKGTENIFVLVYDLEREAKGLNHKKLDSILQEVTCVKTEIKEIRKQMNEMFGLINEVRDAIKQP